MKTERFRGLARAATSLALLSCATHAHAHIKQLKPASWLIESNLGAPQKGSPCGPGDARPFIGDDVQPIPVSDAVTTFRAGETIAVEWDETVYHPGYFRISLARTRAAEATSEDFPDPPLIDPMACTFDEAAVATTPHDNVLADGLFKSTEVFGEGRSLKHEVTLPDEPCDHCTLQIVQVMKDHGGSSCFYFHCAEIEIVAAGEGGSDAGAAGSAAGAGAAGAKAADAGPSGSGGRTDAGSPDKRSDGAAEDSDSDGCAVSHAGAGSSAAAGWCLLGIALAYYGRRRRSRFART
jgi:hypothetical protein